VEIGQRPLTSGTHAGLHEASFEVVVPVVTPKRPSFGLRIRALVRRMLVVRCRRKIPSGQEPSAVTIRLPEPGRGYQLSASHH
jgi:hypothetical protein